jgi:glycosyltransferase involved in cell wall biosynthesis
MAMRHYNNAPFVEAALEGALAQTYTPLDIVFVDDCSTDGGYEIAERIIAGYRGPHRVVLSRNERNIGLGSQSSRILALSRGEIIVFADADDISLPTRCQKIYEAFRDGGAEMLGVISHFDLIDAVGARILGLPPKFNADRADSSSWTAEMIARDAAGPSGAVAAFRRRVFEVGVPLDGLRQSDDSVCGLRCMVLGRLVTLHEVLVLRRAHLDNMSGSIRPNLTGTEFSAWLARYLRERVLVPAFMRRDLSMFEKRGLVSSERAETLRGEIAVTARRLKMQRIARRLPWWRAWLVYFGFRRLPTPFRQSVRLMLQAVAPSIAVMFVRRNRLNRLRMRTTVQHTETRSKIDTNRLE